MNKLNFSQDECEQVMQAIDLLNLLSDLLQDNTIIPHKNTTYFENVTDQHKMGQLTHANMIQLNNLFEKYGCELKYHEEGLTKLFEVPEVISTGDNNE